MSPDVVGIVGGVLFQRGLCILPYDSTQYEIEGSIFNLLEKRLTIRISPCSLADPTQCIGEVEINQGLMLFTYPNSNLELNKIDDFKSQVVKSHLLGFNTNINSIH